MAITREFLLKHTSDSVFVLDDANVVTAANARAETLLLMPATEIVGAPIGRAFPDFAGSRAEAQLAEHAASTIERRIDHFSPSRYTWYEIRMVRCENERVLFVRDVTDRMRQTRSDAVREAVRQIVMEAPIPISITRGREHRYELVNTMARRLLGDREVEGLTARAAFPEVDPALFAMLDEVYSSGRTLTVKDLAVAFDRDGSGELIRGVFDVTYQPLVEVDGAVSGILSVSVERVPLGGAEDKSAAARD